MVAFSRSNKIKIIIGIEVRFSLPTLLVLFVTLSLCDSCNLHVLCYRSIHLTIEKDWSRPAIWSFIFWPRPRMSWRLRWWTGSRLPDSSCSVRQNLDYPLFGRCRVASACRTIEEERWRPLVKERYVIGRRKIPRTEGRVLSGSAYICRVIIIWSIL